MSDRPDLRYAPDYAVPPGETLKETLQKVCMSQAELAERTGRPAKTINEIVRGKTAITPDTAIQFERVLGVAASFWNNLEKNYREALAARKETENLASALNWLRTIPVRALVKENVIPECADPAASLKAVLNFFGIGTVKAWQDVWSAHKPAFRRSPAFKSSPGAVAAWMRMGELAARRIDTRPYSHDRFAAALETIRGRIVTPPHKFQHELRKLCSDAGVAVVFIPELPKTHLSGATYWLTPDKAVIQLSLRHKTDDHLWFTFFHEAGHILRHGKRDTFLENDGANDPKEKDADKFASDVLISPAKYREFRKVGLYDAASITTFARRIGVPPGVVVGRLQHDKLISFAAYNDLKMRLELASERQDSAKN